MEDATYELILDKCFVLHVRRSDVGEVTMPLST
jgi:hypothetical protein